MRALGEAMKHIVSKMDASIKQLESKMDARFEKVEKQLIELELNGVCSEF